MPVLDSLLPTQLSEVVEILCIAVLVYFLLRMVRGTMAASILRGVIILAGIGAMITWFLVTSYDMQVLGQILATIAGIVTTALLIVFQPEMRRGLLSLGEYQMLRGWAPQVEGCEDEIVRSIEGLIANRHGALFCIERRNALNHIAKTGVELDARPSAELFASIFWPKSPLHDGGVVIRGDRVVAAACLLPVTERRDLELRLGTRHRAGIGLSEESDAIVVIVSEETGRVSIAVEGQLSTVDDLADLAERLQKMRGQTPDDEHTAAQIALSGSATQIVAPADLQLGKDDDETEGQGEPEAPKAEDQAGDLDGDQAPHEREGHAA